MRFGVQLSIFSLKIIMHGVGHDIVTLKTIRLKITNDRSWLKTYWSDHVAIFLEGTSLS